jgi:hypothetical protein
VDAAIHEIFHIMGFSGHMIRSALLCFCSALLQGCPANVCCPTAPGPPPPPPPPQALRGRGPELPPGPGGGDRDPLPRAARLLRPQNRHPAGDGRGWAWARGIRRWGGGWGAAARH